MPVVRVTAPNMKAHRLQYYAHAPRTGETIEIDGTAYEVVRVRARSCTWDSWTEVEAREVRQLSVPFDAAMSRKEHL